MSVIVGLPLHMATNLSSIFHIDKTVNDKSNTLYHSDITTIQYYSISSFTYVSINPQYDFMSPRKKCFTMKSYTYL